MELITNITNTSVPRSTASKIAEENASRSVALLRQKLSREIALKNAALKSKEALTVLLESTRDSLSEAYKKISDLEAKIFDLEAELKEAKAKIFDLEAELKEAKSKKNKKEKKQDVEASPVEQEFTVIS